MLLHCARAALELFCSHQQRPSYAKATAPAASSRPHRFVLTDPPEKCPTAKNNFRPIADNEEERSLSPSKSQKTVKFEKSSIRHSEDEGPIKLEKNRHTADMS